MFIYILNSHCYEINENVKEFERLHWEKTEDIDNEVDSMTVSNKYNIRQQSINKELPKFMNTQDEVIDVVKSYDTKSVEDIKIVTIVFNDYLDTLLFGIINNLRYTPEIKMMSGKIAALLVKYDNVIFFILLWLTQKQMKLMFGSKTMTMSCIIMLMMHFTMVLYVSNICQLTIKQLWRLNLSYQLGQNQGILANISLNRSWGLTQGRHIHLISWT